MIRRYIVPRMISYTEVYIVVIRRYIVPRMSIIVVYCSNTEVYCPSNDILYRSIIVVIPRYIVVIRRYIVPRMIYYTEVLL